MKRVILALLACLALGACAQGADRASGTARRIISLDYCADQYVLRFAKRGDIIALSPEARRRYSYLRAEAEGLPQVRPRTADVLALGPTLVVRSYGGGPGIEAFLERAGVKVVQLGYPETLAEVRAEVIRVGTQLGDPRGAQGLAADMDRRLAELGSRSGKPREALYVTPGGVTAGPDTMIDELLRAAGLANFQQRPGWNPIPLERLAYQRPDLVALGFFEAKPVAPWSAARHPVARAQLEELPVVLLEGAWTSCGAWFLVDAVEALAAGAAP
ncbi:MAG: ABC transporter substrate-binding protein [Erythrobacter sp.]|jgi:iron complex transport system substrate-binding protein|nr:ABC transporter substrate-binding protein [Erythrobacter sp.]